MDGAVTKESGSSASAPAASLKRRIGIEFPPVKDRDEIASQQRAAVAPEEIRRGMSEDIPPVVRSVLELAHLMVSGHSQKLRASPGYQGGLFFRGRPFCFASGYRDGTRPRDMDDKGNHMRLKDPLNYGTLSLPITAAFLCELHGRQVLDLRAPLAAYLPELDAALHPDATARAVLAGNAVVDERRIVQHAHAHPARPHTAWNMCAAAQRHVFEPIQHFFAAGAAARSGQQQREHLVQFLRPAPRFTPRPLGRMAVTGRVPHFSIALVAAAVERQLRGESFEAAMRRVVFEPAQSHGAGYGPPKLWRDPGEMFYQPTGLALQHQGFRKPIKQGEAANCGPLMLNPSLNLYAPVEDFGKLLLLAVDAIRHARGALGTPHASMNGWDLGVEWLNGGRRMQLTRHVWGMDYLPTAASFRYDCEKDLGCFGICNSGTRDGCILANTISRMIQHLFVRHVIEKGVDAEAGPDLDNPMKAQSETEEKFQKIVKQQEYSSYFKKHDAHKRY